MKNSKVPFELVASVGSMGRECARSDARHLSARAAPSTSQNIASFLGLGVAVFVGVALVLSRPNLGSSSRGVISPVSLLSSACISSQAESCDVKVPGGFLTLSNIQFPNGKDKAGTADAIGTVHGQAVQGNVQVTAEDSFKVKKEDDPEATWIPTIPGNGNSNETGTFRVLDSQNGVLDSQYERAMKAMIHNLKARQAAANKAMTDEAASAVSKALSSSLVSSTIAKMALSVAEARYKEADQDLSKTPPSSPSSPSSSSLASSTALPAILSQLPAPSLPRAARSSSSSSRTPTQTLRQQHAPTALAEAAAAAAATEAGAAANPTMGEGGGGESFTGLPQLASETLEANPAADGTLGPAAGHWGGDDCKGCTLCPECCASGWIPGCGGYKEELGGKWGRGATIGEDLQSRYAFDQSEAANIDRRLDGQYQQVMGQFLAGREQQRRRAVLGRLKDKRRDKMVATHPDPRLSVSFESFMHVVVCRVVCSPRFLALTLVPVLVCALCVRAGPPRDGHAVTGGGRASLGERTVGVEARARCAQHDCNLANTKHVKTPHVGGD